MLPRTLARDEGGSIAAFGLSWLAAAAVALVLLVDLTAYQMAGARAQAAADAAALAVVAATDPRGGVTRDPTRQARSVAAANGADLVACTCHRGAREVTVTVEIEVRAIAVTRFAGRRVEATSRARLVPTAPEDDAPPPGS